MNASTELDPSVAFEVAALRLHLVVGMAAADGEIHDSEVTELAEFVSRCAVTDAQRKFLEQLLLALIANPPKLEELLRAIVERMDTPGLAQELLEDLVAVAQVDDRIDPREEGMLRLVCGALRIDPISLHEPQERAGGNESAEDLARLVRNLLEFDAAA